jgi:hypothetical protein
VKRRFRWVLLCEDGEHERLFRPILEEFFGKYSVRVVRGKRNGGFTFVFSHLEDEVKYVRKRPTEAVGLLVVVDGDQVGFRDRLAKIQEVVRKAEAGFKAKKPDRIAICVPSRNVETWELWLCGFLLDPDEKRDYKTKFQRELKSISRSQLLKAWDAPLSDEQRQAEAEILPALASGRAEIDRLKKLAKA